MNKNNQQNDTFSNEQISNFIGYANTLNKIRKRLLDSGNFIIGDGYLIEFGDFKAQDKPVKNN